MITQDCEMALATGWLFRKVGPCDRKAEMHVNLPCDGPTFACFGHVGAAVDSHPDERVDRHTIGVDCVNRMRCGHRRAALYLALALR